MPAVRSEVRMADDTDPRVRRLNDRPEEPGRDHVLYWSQMYRRLDHNHALDRACRRARALRKPLVVYEGLKLGYPWASARHHRFILEGMRDNARLAAERGVNYWPFVETPADSGRGLLRRLAGRACLVVTDDYPSFIVPGQSEALAARADVAVEAVDGNGVVPLARLGDPPALASHLRPRLHKAFADAWKRRADPEPAFAWEGQAAVDPPFEPWRPADLDAFVASLPIDQTVPAVAERTGGPVAGRRELADFLARRFRRYAEDRNTPRSLADGVSSGLSPYLHYGHISAEEVVAAVFRAVDFGVANLGKPGKRDTFFGPDPNANAFLDEAVTWRDLGYLWHARRDADAASLQTALPPWAKATLGKHAGDPRDHRYTLEEWEAGATHDELWNAAQRELVRTGRIHNYLRMLWGKKVVEWTDSPAEAYRVLEHLNNKYALDGRDPNSYSGILWCFGLFDRPWAPERPVFGMVRYMSSPMAYKKFDLKPYLAYIRTLG
jgi:deoxyribodipyrimidine photo-lyase